MTQLFGDATLGGDYAWLRLEVDDQVIASVTGEGHGVGDLARDVRRMTLLEAAATPGETLALEALHAAIGQSVRAPSSEGRTAVAMSGGVDSAMALHSALECGPDAVGVTLRLWVDPRAPDTERAGARI